MRKYRFDEIYQTVFANGFRAVGKQAWQRGDVTLIDGVLVNGTAKAVGRLAGVLRHLQSGYLYHYAFAMIIGLLVLVTVFVMKYA